MKNTHTPGPYEIRMGNIVYSNNDIFFADCGCAADAQMTPNKNASNAAFIVRACNSHDGLVAALEGMIRMADTEAAHGSKSWSNAAAFARTILAKAKG